MFEKGLFELTIANLEYVYQAILGENDLEPLRKSNFTAIRSTNNLTLIKRIERDFECYLRNVLLTLPKNSREEAAAILDVVQRDTLDRDDIRVFLERQTTLLPSLDHIPDGLHAMLFKLGAIEPNWANCLAFMEGDGFESDSLAEYLDREDVRAAILKHAIPNDSDSQKLRQFLFHAGSLSNTAYQEYAQALPKPFSIFPEGLDPSKLRILIDERKVTFSKENLDALVDATDLQVLFVATNINTYLAGPDDFALDDNFRERLLRTEIDDGDKVAIVQLMDLSSLVGLPGRSALIGPIINHPDANISKIDTSIAQSLISHAASIAMRISLFNKLHSLMSDEEVRQVLANLPQPFSEIKTGYGRPRLKNSPENLRLVEWLDTRSIISSWSEGSLFTDDIRVNLYR